TEEKHNVTSYDAMAVMIISLQTLIGLGINAFIASVLCITWVKKKNLNANEKILLFLGCCRFWYLCIIWMFSFFSIIYPRCTQAYPNPQIFSCFQIFFGYSNLWVSTFLCIFYCIKIANFRHSCFIYLKGRIDRIVPWLLLGSVLLALIISILVLVLTSKASHDIIGSIDKGIFWKLNSKLHQKLFPLLIVTGFGFTSAFVAVLTSALLLLFSLWRHKHKMQTNSGKNFNMDAHIKAMKSILSFFLLYSFNFTCLVVALVYAVKRVTLVDMLVFALQYVFPTFHSLVLIFSNPKLEKTLQRSLSWVKRKVCMR
ncbi:TA2R7 protein, partial [Turnix velox]|nr:TA2R7 protein [Turnix velox]